MESNNPQVGLHVGLAKAAEYFRDKMFQKIDSERLPDVIKSATTVEPPVVSGDSGHVDIVIDTSEKGAPMAGAFEYGSGIHGSEGKEYVIRPKNAPALAFPWQPDYIPWGSPKFKGVIRTGEGTEGTYFFHYVEHPGVEAVPYIRPTIIENRKEIAKIINKEFIASITFKGKVTIIE